MGSMQIFAAPPCMGAYAALPVLSFNRQIPAAVPPTALVLLRCSPDGTNSTQFIVAGTYLVRGGSRVRVRVRV